ncbi:hypothetical protein [Pseudomonas sp. LAIL14HWK12:I2]|jgi:hypothetical protein|uniref:hypothetical protein n=1 Tax=unclassified Pseudomonas TaxID=196821 RepID=UPI001067F1CC|nr:hypothetical protein [Pseudomonas sp. LAIL14HWK12:I2]
MPTTIVKNIPVGLIDEELRTRISAKFAVRVINIERDPQGSQATITWEPQINRILGKVPSAVFVTEVDFGIIEIQEAR